jgi:predicted nucleic acid-binding protein
MARRVLDTSVLIAFWRRRFRGSLQRTSDDEAAAVADELAIHYKTRAIVTPVYLEFVAGVRTAHELKLARAFLARLTIIDDRRILAENWDDAQRRAQRVPRNGRPRDFADCLIAALAERFHYEVWSLDSGFPH